MVLTTPVHATPRSARRGLRDVTNIVQDHNQAGLGGKSGFKPHAAGSGACSAAPSAVKKPATLTSAGKNATPRRWVNPNSANLHLQKSFSNPNNVNVLTEDALPSAQHAAKRSKVGDDGASVASSFSQRDGDADMLPMDGDDSGRRSGSLKRVRPEGDEGQASSSSSSGAAAQMTVSMGPDSDVKPMEVDDESPAIGANPMRPTGVSLPTRRCGG